MGDTGSLTVGMMLCLLSLKLTMCGTDDNTVHINPMVLAFSPLLIPCCDVVRVYLHRVRNGKNPFLPDKNHFHHKLLRTGMRVRMVMVTILGIALSFIGLNAWLAWWMNITFLLAINLILWSLLHLTINCFIA